MSLLLPPAVQADMEVRNHAMAGKALDRALRDHDPHLSLVWIKSNIHPEELPDTAIPGRFHVRRENPGLLPTYTAIAHSDGSYREPDFGVLREIQERDTWRPGGLKEMLDRAHAPTEKQKQQALHREQRLDVAKEDFRAAKRVAGEDLHERNWGKGGKGIVG